MAAKKLGLTEVPVMVAEGWTDAQKSAYVIADNKIAITGSGWDEDMLAVELKGLAEEGFDLGLTGFSLKEIGSLNKGLGRGGDAPMQDTPESWVVIIECTDEQDQVELIERMQEEGRKVRGSIA